MSEFGIDELARRAGTTVRNVRLYVERGLLPRPRREGRTARYGHEHLARLQLVLRLIARGYTLATIRELTDAWDTKRGLGHVLGLDEALAQPFSAEEPRRVDIDELTRRFPSDDPAATLQRSVELGIVVPDGDAFIVPSPDFYEVGAELVETGVPIDAVLDVAALVRSATGDLAAAFVQLFMRHVWEPFEDAGEPDDQVAAITEAINRQRPLATKVVVAALAQAMQDQVDAALMMETTGDVAAS